LGIDETGQWYEAKRAPGVLSLVMNCDGPARLDIQAVQRLKDAESDGALELQKPRGLRPGDRVEIIDGVMKGQFAVLLQLKPSDRIVILLTMFGSQQRCEMPRAAVARAEPKRLA
jgi:transcription antitermination factor NusG